MSYHDCLKDKQRLHRKIQQPRLIDINSLPGRGLLLAMTVKDSCERITHEIQLYGIIQSITAEQITLARQTDGKLVNVPTIFENINPARPGSYTLKTTGQVIENPDYFSIWTVRNASTDFLQQYLS